jgi:hypothetical protein
VEILYSYSKYSISSRKKRTRAFLPFKIIILVVSSTVGVSLLVKRLLQRLEQTLFREARSCLVPL